MDLWTTLDSGLSSPIISGRRSVWIRTGRHYQFFRAPNLPRYVGLGSAIRGMAFINIITTNSRSARWNVARVRHAFHIAYAHLPFADYADTRCALPPYAYRGAFRRIRRDTWLLFSPPHPPRCAAAYPTTLTLRIPPRFCNTAMPCVLLPHAHATDALRAPPCVTPRARRHALHTSSGAAYYRRRSITRRALPLHALHFFTTRGTAYRYRRLSCRTARTHAQNDARFLRHRLVRLDWFGSVCSWWRRPGHRGRGRCMGLDRCS